MNETIRVFVGTDESQMVAAGVLEHTLRKSTRRPLEVTPLCGLPVPMPQDPRNRPRTPFSFARFLIPSLCGYQGRAIYLDADMIVFRDIAQLFDLPFGGARVLCTRQERTPPGFKAGRQMSVLLLDCSRLDWKAEEVVAGLDRGAYSYEQLMGDLCIVPPGEIAETIPPEWNCLEHFEQGSTALLHYTELPRQPWRNGQNPLRWLWIQCFDEALKAGFLRPEEVEQAIARGYMDREFAGRLKGPPRGNGQEATTGLSPVAELEQLRREVASLRQELAGVHRSWTWRVGRLFVGPAAKVKKLIR